MKIDILTLFPDMFAPVLGDSIIGKAQEKKLVSVEAINIRDFSASKHKSVDDYPFGGGEGMVMQMQPIDDAMKSIQAENKRVVYMSPKGQTFNHEMALSFAKEEELIILCGHYEGVDQRVIDRWVTDEVSIGDYVLTGGEIPAMVMVDAVARLVPGVLSCEASYEDESIASGLLEYPQYSRPREYDDMEVPEILLSGNHQKIEEWRFIESLKLTYKRRRDLFNKYISDQTRFTKRERKLIKETIDELREKK